MDRYSITARIYPMILFYFPLNILVIGIAWDFQKDYQIVIPVGFAGLLLYLSAQLGRDAGKLKESKLWLDWGGAPTTQLFRWRNTRINHYTKSRNHLKMEQLCSIGHPVDEAFELNNPIKADDIYSAWTRFIIDKTRDTKKYSLIFKENMAYGFRRNLWGLKSYAIGMLIFLMIFTYFYNVYITSLWRPDLFNDTFKISEICFLILLSFWSFVVTKNWVFTVAFAYAERLHESIETIN